MQLAIREATIEDTELLAELNKDVQLVHANGMPHLFKRPSDSPDLVSEMKVAIEQKGYFAFIASIDKLPAGYVLAEHFRKDETVRHNAHDMIYVHHISVRPMYQRKGVGSALLDAAKAHGKSIGVELFALDVWSFNSDAKEFFQNYGLANFNEKMWMKV
jgi:diamine N-acetyltransferase